MEKCDLSNEVLKILRKIIRAIDLQSKQLVKEYGLTGPQILILKEAYAREGITVTEVASNINLSQSTVTNIVDRLEKRGLLTKKRSDRDKRRVIVSIEAPGLEMIKSDPSLLQEHFVDRFRKIPDWEQTAILSSLQRVAAMMDATEIDESPATW